MGAKFVCVDRDTPLLMPPDLREWVPKNHLVHCIRPPSPIYRTERKRAKVAV